MNPQVQNNLNELIKTQRSQIMRISTQDLSFREDIRGLNERSPDRNTGNMIAKQNNEDEKVAAFNQSLSSKSKLIRVPNNQFTNKLKEKAENFEL